MNAQAQSLAALGFSWEIVDARAVGRGAIAWLAVGPCAQGLGPVTALKVEESGAVPVLELRNEGAQPILVPGHLVVSGGLQTRAIERSVVVPAGASVRVPVKCVERGRWSPRDGAKTFTHAGH